MSAILSPEKLTSKEIEILTLLNRGKFNREIAGILNLTIDTVKKHTKNLLKKLDASTKSEAIVRGREYLN